MKGEIEEQEMEKGEQELGKKRNRKWKIKQEQEKGNDIENETLIYID